MGLLPWTTQRGREVRIGKQGWSAREPVQAGHALIQAAQRVGQSWTWKRAKVLPQYCNVMAEGNRNCHALGIRRTTQRGGIPVSSSLMAIIGMTHKRRNNRKRSNNIGRKRSFSIACTTHRTWMEKIESCLTQRSSDTDQIRPTDSCQHSSDKPDPREFSSDPPDPDPSSDAGKLAETRGDSRGRERAR